ncbi:MAG: transcriptional regulator [Nitriliruptoraceae bacterium]|nr:transcriptional regulator [Nitriliruptoraceae bacterium]
MSDDEATSKTQALGARLRGIRNQQGLSLAQVEERSNGVWKAVVIGAYERGDRSISLPRLASLAEFYGVPIIDLLPGVDASDTDGDATSADGKVTLDLTRLDPREPRLAPIARFAAYVRRRRGDHNGRMLTLRGGDLQTIALAIGRSPEQVLVELERHGIVRGPITVDETGLPAVQHARPMAPPPELLRARPRRPQDATLTA